jgi:hypothetical protein
MGAAPRSAIHRFAPAGIAAISCSTAVFNEQENQSLASANMIASNARRDSS